MFDRVNTALYNALSEAGIELPFPQLDLRPRLSSEDRELLAGMVNSTQPTGDDKSRPGDHPADQERP
jgi:small-conductance mechanosensitive channel